MCRFFFFFPKCNLDLVLEEFNKPIVIQGSRLIFLEFIFDSFHRKRFIKRVFTEFKHIVYASLGHSEDKVCEKSIISNSDLKFDRFFSEIMRVYLRAGLVFLYLMLKYGKPRNDLQCRFMTIPDDDRTVISLVSM